MVKTKNPKYYTYIEKKKRYEVRKTINGEFHFFGEYSNKKDAKALVTGLKKAEWDINKLEPKYREIYDNRKNIVKGYSKDKRTGKYIISKYHNGKGVHYGTVPTEEEAIKYVKALNSVDYNVELLPEEFKKYVPKRVTGEPKYYHYNEKSGKWHVHKCIKGLPKYFGRFNTEEEAQKVVEELKKHNWNTEEIPEIKIGNKKISLIKQSNKSKKIVKHKWGKKIKEYNPGCLSNPRYDTGLEIVSGSIQGTYNKLHREEK